MVLLTYFIHIVSYYTPWNHQETSDFFIFSGGKEKDQGHEKQPFTGVLKNSFPEKPRDLTKKRIMEQVFCSEFYEIFQNSF